MYLPWCIQVGFSKFTFLWRIVVELGFHMRNRHACALREVGHFLHSIVISGVLFLLFLGSTFLLLFFCDELNTSLAPVTCSVALLKDHTPLLNLWNLPSTQLSIFIVFYFLSYGIYRLPIAMSPFFLHNLYSLEGLGCP